MRWLKAGYRCGGEQGAALLIILLVTGMATVLVVSLVSSQQLAIRRTGNVLGSGQAFWLALGVEAFGVQVLEADKNDSKTDHPGEYWAMGLFPTQVEGGVVSGYLDDLQGRFNLNNLSAKNADFKTYSGQQFQRLLSTCELDPEVAQAVEDWLDEDIDLLFPAGAEDETYGDRQPPYRTANRDMVSVSELRLVSGITDAGFRCLEPLVSALPDTSYLNVNTAPARVLAALAEPDKLSLAAAEDLAESRPEDGYASVADFLKAASLTGADVKSNFLGVSSDYFQAHSRVEVGNAAITLFSLLHRKGNKVEVVRRSIGVN